MTTASLVTCQASFSGCYRHPTSLISAPTSLRQIHSQVRKSGPRRKGHKSPVQQPTRGETTSHLHRSGTHSHDPLLAPCLKTLKTSAPQFGWLPDAPFCGLRVGQDHRGFLFNHLHFWLGIQVQRGRGAGPQVTSLSKGGGK